MKSFRMLPVIALLLAPACGGGGGGSASSQPVAPAQRLAYTDPPDTTQWRLVRNSGSSNARLVLDLLPPAGAEGRGVALVLNSGASASWAAVEGSALVRNLAYTGDLVARSSVQGNDLRVLLSQSSGPARVYGGSAVFSVALSLNPSSAVGSVPLSVAQSAHLSSATAPDNITVAVGTLRAE